MTKTASLLGQPVPDFALPSTGRRTFRLSEQRRHRLALYFYPRDDTPGCTTESAGFRDRHRAFARAGCRVYGISRDSLASHERFKAKLALPFDLLSDTDETACVLFSVIRMKTLYGKKVRGIERSTFVLDEHGVLMHEWRGVKVPGHVEEVLRFVQDR